MNLCCDRTESAKKPSVERKFQHAKISLIAEEFSDKFLYFTVAAFDESFLFLSYKNSDPNLQFPTARIFTLSLFKY